MQILRKKYDMGYLQPSWLGRRWQPWYQDLLQLAGVKGNLPLLPAPAASRIAKPEYINWFNILVPKPHARVSQDIEPQPNQAQPIRTMPGHVPLGIRS